MPHFIALVTLTTEGRKTIKDSPRRTKVIGGGIIKKLGGKILSLHYTLGLYDIVVVLDFPNVEAFMSFVYAGNAVGTSVVTPLIAIPDEQAFSLINKLAADGLL